MADAVSKMTLISVVAAFCTCVAGPASAGGAARHTVTVTVIPANESTDSERNTALVIDSAASDSGELSAMGAAAHDLGWGTSDAPVKVTAESDQETPMFAITVEIVRPGGGTGLLGRMTLSTTPTDLVPGASRTTGSPGLVDGGAATGAQAIGPETHRIVYTITAG